MGKFPALPVRQNLFAGLQLRKTTCPRFPFMRYPRQQRMSKRTILARISQCAVKKVLVSRGCKSHPATGRSSRKQSERQWR